MLDAAGPARGDVPTWVGSIGTVAAFGVAAGAYAQSQFDRRRSQAGKVTAWVSGGPIFFPDPVLDELEQELVPAFAPEIPVDRPRVWVEFSIQRRPALAARRRPAHAQPPGAGRTRCGAPARSPGPALPVDPA